MGKIRRKFDVSFKIQVCQRIEAGIQTVADISRDNQISRPVVESWLQKYVAGNLAAGSSNREKELEREVEKLQSKVGQLTMTIDLLKKVEAWKKQQTSAASSIITSRNLAQFQKPARPPVLPRRATTTNPQGTR